MRDGIAQKMPLICSFIHVVYGNGILGKLDNNFGCKSAAITICCYTSLTLSIPSSKSTFSQPFQEKCISEVVRTGTRIIFQSE